MLVETGGVRISPHAGKRCWQVSRRLGSGKWDAPSAYGETLAEAMATASTMPGVGADAKAALSSAVPVLEGTLRSTSRLQLEKGTELAWRGWRAKPLSYEGARFWTVLRRSGENDSREWREEGTYPSSSRQLLVTLLEFALKDAGGTVTPDVAAEIAECVAQSLREVVDDARA